MMEGGCQCGAIRYALEGEPIDTVVCHCSRCRRAHGAPAVAWTMFPKERVRLAGDVLRRYASSPGSERGFCPKCGTQITFEADYMPGLVDVAVGTLDDPERVRPSLHCWTSSGLSWAEFADGLPRHPEFPVREDPEHG